MKAIVMFLKTLSLKLQMRRYFKKHSLEDFELALIFLGCVRSIRGDSEVFTTPNGKGEIIVTKDGEILVGGKS